MPDVRVSLTLPPDIARELHQLGQDRGRFVVEAVTRELTRRRRENLRRSLREPHAEVLAHAEEGLAGWAQALPEDATASLLDPRGGTPVRWTPGKGWSKRKP